MKTYNVFISHSWKHVDDLTNLRNLLVNRERFNVIFHEKSPDDPINTDSASVIKRILSQEIGKSDVMLAMAGGYATRSKWMEWELDKAVEKNIPIIGIKPWGDTNVSKTVQDKAKIIVNWNTESIVKEIRKFCPPSTLLNAGSLAYLLGIRRTL